MKTPGEEVSPTRSSEKIRRATVNAAKYSCFCRIAAARNPSSHTASTSEFAEHSQWHKTDLAIKSPSDLLTSSKRGGALIHKSRSANLNARFLPTPSPPSA